MGGEVREELGSAFGGLGGALRFRPQLPLRRCPQVAPRAPHERLADGEGGLSHALAPGRAVLREGGPLDEGEREIKAFEVVTPVMLRRRCETKKKSSKERKRNQKRSDDKPTKNAPL